jgi:hypothetical protein
MSQPVDGTPTWPFLPGDRDPDNPADWEPSADGLPPVSAQIGTAVASALLWLEARRWWLEAYHGDHVMRDAELDAIDTAIRACEQALACQRRRRAMDGRSS